MRPSIPLALIGLVMGCCTEGGTLPSPTVRVDLSRHLPGKALRRFVAADTSYQCDRTVTVTSHGASQRFVVAWRVFEADEGQRHITAVQVDPDGPFSGARGPKASAAVNLHRGGKKVSVQISWQATRGCGTIHANQSVTLHPDDSGCKPPRPAGKIFSE